MIVHVLVRQSEFLLDGRGIHAVFVSDRIAFQTVKSLRRDELDPGAFNHELFNLETIEAGELP